MKIDYNKIFENMRKLYPAMYLAELQAIATYIQMLEKENV